MVYFMQSVEGGPVKIGTSIDVDHRRKQLETRYGKPLAILGVIPGDREVEQSIHAKFAHLRFGRTEQFRPESDLMEFIGRPLLVGLNPNAVEVMLPVKEESGCTVAMRCTQGFKSWLEDFADKQRLTPTQLLELGLVEMAKKTGHPDPPKR